MRKPKKRVQTRTIAAAVLICSSFLSAYLLSSLATRTQLLWSAKTTLVPGTEVLLNELVAKKVAIPSGTEAYISISTDVTHYFVLRAISPGELLPSSALSADPEKLRMSAVPISVHTSDLPAYLEAGEVINLYHVGDPHLAKETFSPNLVISHAYILGIDRKGQNLGGDLTLTVSVDNKDVAKVLDATASGRVVAVRLNG